MIVSLGAHLNVFNDKGFNVLNKGVIHTQFSTIREIITFCEDLSTFKNRNKLKKPYIHTGMN